MWLEIRIVFPFSPCSRSKWLISRRPPGSMPLMRLVQQQNRRIVDQGLGQFDALPHAVAAAGQSPASTIRHANFLDHLFGAPAGISSRHPVEPGHDVHEIAAGHLFVERVDVGAVAKIALGSRRPGVVLSDAHLALAGTQLPTGQLHQGRFARAVGAEQPGDARPDATTDVVYADDRAVELGDVIECEEQIIAPS